MPNSQILEELRARMRIIQRCPAFRLHQAPAGVVQDAGEITVVSREQRTCHQIAILVSFNSMEELQTALDAGACQLRRIQS